MSGIAAVDAIFAAALGGDLPVDDAIARIAALAEGGGDRRARGSFFTPEDVTSYMAAATVVPALAGPLMACGAMADCAGLISANADLVSVLRTAIDAAPEPAVAGVAAKLAELVVLDPTCGAGAFLVAATRVLRDIDTALAARLGTSPSSCLHRRVRGADIAPLAVHACRVVLALDAARAGDLAAARPALADMEPLVRELDATTDLQAAAQGWLPDRGVDVVLGNPPYVRAVLGPPQHGMRTSACGNLYAWVAERALATLAPGGHCGLVVPISAVCTDAFESFRELWRDTCDAVWVSNFDTIPATLFPGTVQRVSIFLGVARADESSGPGVWHVTAYRKWRSSERARLFPSLSYVPLPPQRVSGSLPKVGSVVEHRLLERVFTHPPAGELMTPTRGGGGLNGFWYKRRWSYFLLFLDWMPELRDSSGALREPTEFKRVDVVDGVDARALLATYNSSLFYWFFTVFSDNRNVNRRDLAGFPFGPPASDVEEELAVLADELMSALRASSEVRTCTYRSVGTITNTYFRQAATKPVLDRIDAVLARHYGLDNEELDFIRSFETAVRLPASGPRAPLLTAAGR